MNEDTGYSAMSEREQKEFISELIHCLAKSPQAFARAAEIINDCKKEGIEANLYPHYNNEQRND